MTKSMTGFGLSSQEAGDYTISVEVKSLNSKFADINLRMSSQFSSKEITWRKMISDYLVRGKIAVFVDITSESSEESLIDQEQFEKYFTLYKMLGKPVKVSEQELFKMAIQAPGIFKSSNNQLFSAELIDAVPYVIKEAVEACDQFRIQEGAELENKLTEYAKSIETQLEKIIDLDANRSERVGERLKTALMP